MRLIHTMFFQKQHTKNKKRMKAILQSCVNLLSNKSKKSTRINAYMHTYVKERRHKKNH